MPVSAHVVRLLSAGTNACGIAPVILAPLMTRLESCVKPLVATVLRLPVSGVPAMFMLVRLDGSAGSDAFRPQPEIWRRRRDGKAVDGGSEPYSPGMFCRVSDVSVGRLQLCGMRALGATHE